MKLQREGCWCPRFCSLRTHRSAAPLKHALLKLSPRHHVISPHSQECGSVEAQRPLPVRHRPRPLRTHRSAAPLKRTIAAASSPWSPGSLRTHRSAAPLKQPMARWIHHRSDASPHSQECGSVEATSGGASLCGRVRSPHSQECGSVEASPSGRSPAAPGRLSALTGVRLR